MILIATDSVLAEPSVRCASVSELARIEEIERELLKFPQVEVPVRHSFAPGVYVREVVMPTGACVIGHLHRTEHLNVVTRGKATVMFDGVIQDIEVKSGESPKIFKSGRDVRKVLYIHEEMHWMTIHPTHETDLEKLEEQLIIKSGAFLEYEEDIKRLQNHLSPCLG